VTAQDQARRAAAIVVALSCVTVGAAAQGRATGANPNAPKLMVSICRNPDKKLGPDAAEAIRDRVSGDVSTRDLYVFPKQDITNTLESSGYSITDALSPADENALAKIIHADMYIDCGVTKTATGFQLEGSLILSRDMNLVQPLGSYENAKLDGAAAGISREFKNAFRAFDPEKTCRLRDRESKPAEAMKAAQDGIAAYPKSVWLRVCQMGLAVGQKRPPAEIIKIAEEIRAIDPKNQVALKQLFTQYDLTKNTDKKLEILKELYAADPTNANLAKQIANEYAAAGKFAEARAIIEQAVAANPGDVSLVQTYFNVLGALKDTKAMAKVGEEMIKMDTTLADADFYDRMVSAYAADSNYQKASEWSARATVKFPAVADNWVRLGQLQRRNGQTQQAIVSLKRALSIDPKIKNARMIIINSYVDMNQYDSAFVAMHEAVKAGEDPDQIGLVANVLANRTLTAAGKVEPKSPADYQKVVPYALFADSIAKDRSVKNNAKFLIGVSSYYVGSLSYKSMTESKSCEGAKAVNAAALDAQINLPIGGATNAAVVQQLMPATQQLLQASEQAMKAFCKADNGKKPGRANSK
jgi:tetratricopeptide (TPR) repeat protein